MPWQWPVGAVCAFLLALITTPAGVLLPLGLWLALGSQRLPRPVPRRPREPAG